MKRPGDLGCDRCGQGSIQTVSAFNSDMLCHKCVRKERDHPLYAKARRAVQAALDRGDYSFPGIGLPEELKGEPA